MIIKQIRYYDEGYEDDSNKISKKELNYPSDITAQKLVSGEYFDEVKCKEIQIRASSGTKLVINGRTVQIGDVEIYNILYNENVVITSLMVDADSIEHIKNDPREYLVITFVLDDDDETSNNSNNQNNNQNNNNDNENNNDSQNGNSNENIDNDHSSSYYINIQIGRDNHDNSKQPEE